jgi:hypothetical protein
MEAEQQQSRHHIQSVIDHEVARKTGYPTEWVEKATRDLLKKQREKYWAERRKKYQEEKQRLNTLAKSWWKFWE